MQNPPLKFRQSSIVSKKPGYLSENWKLWWASTTTEFNIFSWIFAHVSYLPISAKGWSEFFLFWSWDIDKPGFCDFVETRSFWSW